MVWSNGYYQKQKQKVYMLGSQKPKHYEIMKCLTKSEWHLQTQKQYANLYKTRQELERRKKNNAFINALLNKEADYKKGNIIDSWADPQIKVNEIQLAQFEISRPENLFFDSFLENLQQKMKN